MSTLFVIGAGASTEYGFPVGTGLKHRIIELMKINTSGRYQFDDTDIHCALKLGLRDQSVSEYFGTARLIQTGLVLSPSIDQYIDDQRSADVSLLGKLAIVRSILEYERQSSLYFTGAMPSRQKMVADNANTWLGKLASFLFTNMEDIENKLKSVKIICFNYDRLIEYYLFNALIVYHNLSMDEAGSLIERINIIHPYGQSGLLPWQSNDTDAPVAQFGQNFRSEHKCGELLMISKKIRTYTESTESGIVSRIKSAVVDAKKIIFIGFGFNDQNIELLSADSGDASMIGTAYNLSSDAIDEIKGKLKDNMLPNFNQRTLPIKLRQSITATEIFEHFRIS